MDGPDSDPELLRDLANGIAGAVEVEHPTAIEYSAWPPDRQVLLRLAVSITLADEPGGVCLAVTVISLLRLLHGIRAFEFRD